jgi:hypothetical protein
MLDYYRFKTVSDLFIQGKTEEARLELAELQRRYVALCDENITFKMQVQEYEDILYLARNLILEGQFYWLVTGNVKQGPFCPHCYNRDGLLMRLSGDPGERHCTKCRESFAAIPRQLEKAVVVAQDFSHDGSFIPPLEQSPRKAKVISFSR